MLLDLDKMTEALKNNVTKLYAIKRKALGDYSLEFPMVGEIGDACFVA